MFVAESIKKIISQLLRRISLGRKCGSINSQGPIRILTKIFYFNVYILIINVIYQIGKMINNKVLIYQDDAVLNL